MSVTTPSPAQASMWLDRWDRQQEQYIADREERFTVIADIVRWSSATPIVVDLGAGPGSLSVRILDALPGATCYAVDADDLLLGLAGAAYGDRAGLRIVNVDLRSADWLDALADAGVQPGTVDAVVSTTALHWLTEGELGQVYAAAGALLRPGGVLANGDHVQESAALPGLASLQVQLRERRAARAGVEEAEDWAQWWQAVGEAPELAGLLATRGARPIEHAVPEEPNLGVHHRLLLQAGFTETGVAWQCGDDRVVIGIR